MKMFNPKTGQIIELGVHKRLERLAELRAQGWIGEGEIINPISTESETPVKKRANTRQHEANETFIVQDGNAPAIEGVLDNGDSVELNG